MTKRVLAIIVAASAFIWLVTAVNALGDDATRSAALALQQPPNVPLSLPHSGDAGGLDLVDFYQCMCGSNDDGIKQWARWWLIAAAFGGVPIAFLLRSRQQDHGAKSYPTSPL